MGYWSSFCLKIVLSVKISVKGKENIINNKKFFIAASHQSMFETFFLQTIFNSPIFILKKELLKIPLFGLYLKKIGSISIDRDRTTKENLGFFEKIKKTTYLSKQKIEKKFNFKFQKRNILLTYHPDTIDEKKTIKNLKIILKSLKKLKETLVLITSPNSDAKGVEMIKLIKLFLDLTE